MYIKEILQKHTIQHKEVISERHEIIGKFTDKINQSRQKDGFRELKCSFVNKKMRTLSVQGLHMLYGALKDSPKFDASWWIAIKRTTN